MNFDGSTPQAIPRFGSQAQWDSGTLLPLGLASSVRNSRYRAESTGTRYGFANRLQIAATAVLTGVGVVRYLAEDSTGQEYIKLLTYDSASGNIWAATPYVSSTRQIASTAGFQASANIPLTPNLNPTIRQAFNRGYLAMGNLAGGKAPNLVYAPQTGNLDPVSDKPVGGPWLPSTAYRVGQIVSPSIFQSNETGDGSGTWIPAPNKHLYRVIGAGTTAAAPPAWPTGQGAQVGSGSVTFQEATPFALSGLPNTALPLNPTAVADANSPIAAGATVFVVLTYNSATGESATDVVNPDGTFDTTTVLEWTNTTGGPVDLHVTMPQIPAYIADGGDFANQYAATSYNLYAYIVPGAPDITQYVDPTYYAQFGGPYAPGAVVSINAYPAGKSLPTVTTATVTPAGNVDPGDRYMIVLFQNRNGYITGWTTATPVLLEVTATGFQAYVANLPIGPYNTAARICAFTVAGQSNAGPYYWIPANDIESPGFAQPNVQITQTIIYDNVTTSATFNFTDTYLPGANEVTDYAQRIETPPASDIHFSENLSMVTYVGCPGYPSGVFYSDLDDPEAIRLPNSLVQVAEANGDRLVCCKEIGQIQIACKENGGYVITPDDSDPQNWAVNKLWDKRGPVGPKAVDTYSTDDEDILVFAHRDGFFKVAGKYAQRISREVQDVWDSINWNAGQQICVKIDGKREEISICVPTGTSTTNNVRLTCNYHYGFSDPVIFSARSGKLIPNVEGRKWSVDDLSIPDMELLPQRYLSNVGDAGVDLEYDFLYCGYDGAIYGLEEGQYNDDDYNGNPVGYFSCWYGCPGPRTSNVNFQLNGARMSAIGSGELVVRAIDTKDNVIPLSTDSRRMFLSPTVETEFDFGANARYSTSFNIGFDNGGVAGAWYEVHSAALYMRKWSTGFAG